MAITDINISEELETGAPSIRYTGKEGPRPSMQSQQEMLMAQQIWEAMGEEERGQFSNFQEFFRSGIWRQILQQAQQDEAQGQQGIAGLGPRNMGPNRMGAEYGGRIGYRSGKDVDKKNKTGMEGILQNITKEDIKKNPDLLAMLLLGLRDPDYFMGSHGDEMAYWRQQDVPGVHSIGSPWGYPTDYPPIISATSGKAQGGRIGYQGGGSGDRDPIYQDVSRWLYAKDVQDLTDDEYLRLIKFTRENDAQGGRAGRAQGGRMGYADGTDKGPLYVDENYDLDIPLTNFEKALREMSKEEREEYKKMLESILRQRGNIGRDLAIPGGGQTGKERQMELLNWGTDIPDEETGYKDDYSMRHRAAEYLDRPYFGEHYETGEHFNRGGRTGIQTLRGRP